MIALMFFGIIIMVSVGAIVFANAQMVKNKNDNFKPLNYVGGIAIILSIIFLSVCISNGNENYHKFDEDRAVCIALLENGSDLASTKVNEYNKNISKYNNEWYRFSKQDLSGIYLSVSDSSTWNMTGKTNNTTNKN